MPEKPPSQSPEEKFAFTRDVDSEEFPEEWTPDARRRMKALFEEIGWPIEFSGDEQVFESFMRAFDTAMSEEYGFHQDRFSDKGGDAIPFEQFRDIVFSNFCHIRGLLNAALDAKKQVSSLKSVSKNPAFVWLILQRMKRSLRK